MTEEEQEWYDARPKAVREQIDKFPFGWYVMKEGATYAISCAGTIVLIHAYTERNEIGVVVMGKYKRESALEHERVLGVKHGTPPEEVQELQRQNISVYVDPQFLEFISSTEPSEDNN